MQIQKTKPGYKLVKSRFGKYEEIPKDWKRVKMKDVCKKISVGIATSTTKYFVDDGVPLLRNQNIKEGYIETDDLLHISDEFAKMNQSRKLQEGDVVCMRTGYPGQSAVVPAHMNGWQTFTTLILRPNREFLNPTFLSTFLNSFGRKQITSVQAGAAQQNLNVGWLSNMLIFIPSLNEQEKIASILRIVDDTINKYDLVIETTKRLKKGLVQKLLTKGIGHTKFKKVKSLFGKYEEIPEKWMYLRLENLTPENQKGTIRMGPFGSSLKKHELMDEGKIKTLWIENIIGNKFSLEYKKFITEEKYKKLEGFSVSPDDVLITMMGTLGKVAIVPHNIGLAIISSHLLKITLEQKKMIPEYLFYYILSNNVSRQIIRESRGIVMGGLNTEIIKSLLIIVPPIPEQQKIVSILSKVDSKINDLKSKKTSLETLKKGLMQKLLTGELRV